MPKEEKRKLPWKLTGAIFIIMLIISLTFFFLLNSQTSVGFGFVEILFSIVISLIVAFFLVWLRSFMKNRPYLGTILGLTAIVLASYGLYLKYRGPYTTIFTIVTALIVLSYVGFYFIKYRRSNAQNATKDDFDDKL